MSNPTLDPSSETAVRSNPFPGLRPFEFEESHLFFGRDGQSERLIAKLADKRFLAVVGTSGSGKSSLVRAGLLPALYSGFMPGAGAAWRIAIMRPGNDPLTNLAQALNQPDVFGSDDEANRALQIAITEATLRRGSRGLVEAVQQANLPATENLLVVADQFEELFRVEQTAQSTELENDRAAFVKLLLAAKAQREVNIYVALTMRSDYMGDCSRFWDLPEAINESQYLIPRLTREQIREAITGPVFVGGAEITPRLVNRLLNDVGDNPDQLPILQHALMRTWDHWRENAFVVPPSGGSGSSAETNRLKAELQTRKPIDLEDYEAIGGMEKALSLHADEAFNELPDDRHRLVAEKVFKALTEKGPDNREIRRPVTLGALCGVVGATESEIARVIKTFRKEGRSFLMPPVGTVLTAESLIDISHESLMRNWQRLNAWVEEETGCARIYRRLAETAALHLENKAGLWRNPDLQLALEWQKESCPNKEWAVRYDPGYDAAIAFLEKSATQHTADLEAAERQQRQEVERAQRELAAAQALARAETQRAEEQARSAGKLRFLASTAILIGLIAAVAAYTALKQYQSAEANLTQSRNLLYVSNQLLAWNAFDQKNYLRANDFLEASFPAPKVPTKNDLRSFDWFYLWRQMHDEKLTLKGHTDSVLSVSFSPDGKTVASGSSDSTVKLWDMESEKEPQKLKSEGSSVLSVSLSPDGRMLASGGYDRVLRLWDRSSGQELRKLGSEAFTIKTVSFSTDGLMLASGSNGQTIRLWDVGNGKELQTLEGHTSSVNSVAFSSDSRMLVSGSDDKTLRVWDVKSGQELRKLEGHTGSVNSVAFSPDGRTLASGSDDKTLRLWDGESGKELRTLEGHAGSVNSVAFSSDGRMLVSGSSDKTLKMWDVGGGEGRLKLEGPPYVKSVIFSPDGQILASGGGDKSLKLWEVGSGKELRRLEEPLGRVNSVAFSPDGIMLATGSRDKTLRLWDVGSGQELRKLKRQVLDERAYDINSVAFSPDGRMLATGSDDWILQLWDVTSGKELQTLQGHAGSVISVAFSPDGRTLASGSFDKLVKLWDVGSGKALGELEGHTGSVSSVAFSPDGRMLVSGSTDKTVRLWQVETGKELWKLEGHEDSVNSVMFSPDGRTLASGSRDKTLRLWDVAAGKELGTLKEYAGSINSVAFSPDGQSLASGGGQIVKDGSPPRFGEILLLRGATNAEVARQCIRCGRKE